MNRERPEDIGFVFWEKSRRFLHKDMAWELRRQLDPSIRSIGVFVDAPLKDIVDYVERGIISSVQLHGQEREVDIALLRKALPGIEIIKAFVIQTENDLRDAKNSSADRVLLDSGKGSGTCFDWKLLRTFDRPFYLAGGLNPQTVGAAIQTFSPYAVDVSSGVETEGYKDPDKVHDFIEAVRRSETAEADIARMV